MVSVYFLFSKFVLLNADQFGVAEREAGNDYEQGWKTYGFAAPFSDVRAGSS